jgi:carbamoyltransferase
MNAPAVVLGLLGQPAPQRDVTGSFQSYSNSGWYHNSAAAIVKNGSILAASEEERFTRRKGSGKFPSNALRFCLAQANTTIEDVDLVVFGERGGDGFLLDSEISSARIAEVLRVELGAINVEQKIICVEHHRAHAYSALTPSGYSSALVFTSDGFGDGISGTIWTAEGGVLRERLRNIEFANSLGRFYSSVLPYFSYVDDDEYKIMGLSPYGSRKKSEYFFKDLYSLDADGKYTIRLHDKDRMLSLLGEFGPPRPPGGEFLPHHADVAAGIQTALESIVLHVLCHFQKITGLRSLCLGGGVAQNSVCNGLLRESRIFDRIYIQPAAHDAGIAIGACFAGLADAGAPSRSSVQSAYLGREVQADGQSALDHDMRLFESMVNSSKPENLLDYVAKRLADGAICGWVQGRAEFGPRALGNRSILADPRNESAKERINRAIKNRELFRPFAPVVVAEDASRYFDIEEGEYFPFMTIVVPVRREVTELAAVTHVDGTARLQMVSVADNPLLHALIRAFQSHSGVPVLLNTSFNGNGEPIVDNFHDALSCFLRSDLDMLVIGEVVFWRREDWKDGLRVSSFCLSSNWEIALQSNGEWSFESSSGQRVRVTESVAKHVGDLKSRCAIQATVTSFEDISLLWLRRVLEICVAKSVNHN